MTEEPTGPTPPEEPAPEAAVMPRWVPVAIGVILVTMAALAVITGVRYRENTLVDLVRPRSGVSREQASAPPGEPEPGASRIGAGIPQANEPVEGGSYAEITGGAQGVTSVARMWARRGMQVKAEPSDAVVYVNDVPVGRAVEFDSEDEIYDFAEPGSYNVRIDAPGFRERRFVVTATETVADEVAQIEVKLEKQ
ncbi:MAG TPA: hypothetical protein VF057_01570 [Thermoanaerobaculia bacterium]